jgi:hypothetical protein
MLGELRIQISDEIRIHGWKMIILNLTTPMFLSVILFYELQIGIIDFMLINFYTLTQMINYFTSFVTFIVMSIIMIIYLSIFAHIWPEEGWGAITIVPITHFMASLYIWYNQTKKRTKLRIHGRNLLISHLILLISIGSISIGSLRGCGNSIYNIDGNMRKNLVVDDTGILGQSGSMTCDLQTNATSGDFSVSFSTNLVCLAQTSSYSSLKVYSIEFSGDLLTIVILFFKNINMVVATTKMTRVQIITYSITSIVLTVLVILNKIMNYHSGVLPTISSSILLGLSLFVFWGSSGSVSMDPTVNYHALKESLISNSNE